MNETLMRAIGVRPNLNPVFKKEDAGDLPQSMLSWALHWQACGLTIFPCTQFTGLPLVTHWPKTASKKDSEIVEWWSEHPKADIATIPDAAGCFVVAAVGNEGNASLGQIERFCGEPLLETVRADSSLHRWFPGRAPSQRLCDGLYVFGVGSYLYMPGSLAPDPVARLDVREAV
jgi:hypothetical protein